MTICSLGSGSSGNCLAVRSDTGDWLLVDLGLSCRETCRRAKVCGVDISSTTGILFTHDHQDHYAGLTTFHGHFPDIPLFANGDTADAIAMKTGVEDGWYPFETACQFEVGSFQVTPFALSHDAADPVGYLLEEGGAALFIGTDTGIVTTGMREAFCRCDCAVLESNHDPVLLEQSSRPVSLKQRIRGRSGHLANEDAAELVRETNPTRLNRLLLAHLSSECNSPSRARAVMSETLVECQRNDIELNILSPDIPGPIFQVIG